MGTLRILAHEVLNEQIGLDRFKSGSLQPTNKLNSTEIDKAKNIAKQIYNSKGIVEDDIATTLKAIKKIKNAKEFQLVQTELRKLTKGRGVGQYISEFLGTMFAGIADLNVPETIEDGKQIVYHLEDIKADPKTIALIKKRIAYSEVQKSLTKTVTGNPLLKNSPVGQPFQTLDMINAQSEWLRNHSTWDSFFNGENGLRELVYGDWRGIAVTTALSFLGPLKAIPIAIFGLFLVDDIKRMSEKGFSLDIMLDMIFDAMGLLVGGVGGKIGQAFKAIISRIGKVLGSIFQKLIQSGASRELIERLIIALKPYIKQLAQTKLGQLIASIGSKIAGLVSKIKSAVATSLKTLISFFKDLATKLAGTKAYKYCSAIIKMLYTVNKWIVTSFIDAIKWIFKTLWAIISFPGKSVAWILEKLGFPAAGAQQTKTVFNVAATTALLQNHEKWYNAWIKKNGLEDTPLSKQFSILYNSDFKTFKDQRKTNFGKDLNGQYIKFPEHKDETGELMPWAFIIVKKSEGNMVKVYIAETDKYVMLRTDDIAFNLNELQY